MIPAQAIINQVLSRDVPIRHWPRYVGRLLINTKITKKTLHSYLISEEFVNRAHILLFDVVSAQLDNPTSYFPKFSYMTVKRK